MTNLVKIALYLAFGILGGFCLFWGKIALIFLIAIPIILWLIPHKIHWWGVAIVAIGHGVTFGIMRGRDAGCAFAVISLFIYLVLYFWRIGEWKKKHPAPVITKT